MELKFEELEVDPPTNEVNYTNYWSNATEITTTTTNPTNLKKPKVSYDDILSSLNMVVHNGVLQFAKPTQQKKQVTIIEPNNQRHPNKQQQQPNNQSNNYINNKYFKDYKDESIIEEPPKPLTKEEYKQMLIQNYINRQQAQRRISQIKSKKLLFDTQHINIAPNQNPRDMNKLFKSFKR